MKHIILIGFKHSGKSVIAEVLARQLGRPHLDLDELVEATHNKQTDEALNCRQIVAKHGLAHFRNLEKTALATLLSQELEPQVISVGGGTPLDNHNRQLLTGHTIIHVTAPQGIVFERIMVNGKPAFFPDNGSDFETFMKIWEDRTPIYESLANLTIENDDSIAKAVEKIKTALNL